MNINHFAPSDSRRYYAFISILTLIILSATGYAIFSSNRIIRRYSPLINAGMTIKLEIASAHLWFEEEISGDKTETFEDVAYHLEQAQWFANAMLKGGRNGHGLILPLKDAELRGEIKQCLDNIEEFVALTWERNAASKTSGIGSDIDQKYDRLFKKILRQTDHVEIMLKKKIESAYRHYQSMQAVMILIIVVFSFILFYTHFSHIRELKDNLNRLNEAKEKVQQNERWLKTTMNSMGDGVIITDHNGVVNYLNPVASSLTGWLLNEARDKKISEIFHIINEVTKEPVDNPVNQVIKKNVVMGLANHTELISKDGTVWPISDSAAPIFDDAQNLKGVVIVFHEVTAQKKAEAEGEKLKAQLHQAFKMEAIGTLAGGIAHDFNNILAMIIGNADMALYDLPQNNPAKHNLEEIMKASNRARDLVKHILSFSRRDRKDKSPHNLTLLVQESMKSLTTTIPASVRQRLKLDTEAADEVIIISDATQIHQLLLNLCVNAVQAMDEKGELEVGVDTVSFSSLKITDQARFMPGDYAHLWVKDTGPGIRNEDLKKIFDPFFTTKPVGEGTGMGLSVVHGIIKDHQGQISVESVLGQGTTFHIYFPLTDSLEFLTENQPQYEELPFGYETLLFIDDEPGLADVGKSMLERYGYRVSVETDSIKALEKFRQAPDKYDLVITDQTMPDMTGDELAKEMLSLRPDLPVIVCSGFSRKINKKTADEIGVKAFISKPVRKGELLPLIRQFLDEG